MEFQMFHRLKVNSHQVYLTAQEFLDACCVYFKWVDETPLQEEQVFQYKGGIVRADKAKVRPYTKTGLASHLSIPAARLDSYKMRGGEWLEAIELVEQAIYNHKFEHAAAGLMNAMLIVRDLGLADKTELGGMRDAPPVAFNIMPIATGTFLAPEEKVASSDDA